jgi:phosphatidylglycerol lysyltransferase
MTAALSNARVIAGSVLGFARRHATPLITSGFLLLLLLFLGRERGELSRLGTVLRTARLSWLLVAVAIELLLILLMAWKNRLLLRRLGHRVPLPAMVEIHLQRQVVGTVVPIGGPASTVAFVRFLARWNVPAGDAVFVSLIFSVLGTISVVLLVLPVVAWFAFSGNASVLLYVATVFLVLLMALFGWVFWALLRSDGPPRWIAERMPTTLAVLVEQMRQHRIVPADLVVPLVIAFAVDVLGAFLLAAVLRAVLPARRAGLLAVRARWLDVLVYAVMGGVILGVAIRLHS